MFQGAWREMGLTHDRVLQNHRVVAGGDVVRLAAPDDLLLAGVHDDLHLALLHVPEVRLWAACSSSKDY